MDAFVSVRLSGAARVRGCRGAGLHAFPAQTTSPMMRLGPPARESAPVHLERDSACAAGWALHRLRRKGGRRWHYAGTMRSTYDRINAGDIEGFGALLADDFVEHEETPGFSPRMRASSRSSGHDSAAFPDLRMEAEDMLAGTPGPGHSAMCPPSVRWHEFGSTEVAWSGRVQRGSCPPRRAGEAEARRKDRCVRYCSITQLVAFSYASHRRRWIRLR